MAAVEYVRNFEPSAEVVKMNCSFGELTLTGSSMNCLIRPPSESGSSKWINDKVYLYLMLLNLTCISFSHSF